MLKEPMKSSVRNRARVRGKVSI